MKKYEVEEINYNEYEHFKARLWLYDRENDIDLGDFTFKLYDIEDDWYEIEILENNTQFDEKELKDFVRDYIDNDEGKILMDCWWSDIYDANH